MSRQRIIGMTIVLLAGVPAAPAFVHPGCLSTQADLERMKAMVAAGQEPWRSSWARLVTNGHAQLSWQPNPQEYVCAGGVCHPETFMPLARDCAAAYQCVLRYHISGDRRYAEHAIEIFNAWSRTFKGFTGDSNAKLRAGLYGYQLACAAELLRGHAGWSAGAPDFVRFQQMMLTRFYPENADFLVRHNGTCDSHYWANWDLANVASIMAIGVLCDRQDLFDEAVDYMLFGAGEGALDHAVHLVHPEGLGQWQESGRDQGHNTLGMSLMGPICEIAWNQGVDLYGYDNNRFLAGCEYVARYNLGLEVPYVTYINCEYVVQPEISAQGRGNLRAGWDLIAQHYVNRLGLAAPYTEQMAARVRPEGGGGDYGPNSGGYDSLGFTTLTHTREPLEVDVPPSGLRPVVQGSQVTLSWWGPARATGYRVERADDPNGPWSTVATVAAPMTYTIDPGLTPGQTVFYRVTARFPDGNDLASGVVPATPDGQLTGTVIGTQGSWRDAGATAAVVFDGSLRNFFDAPTGSAWVGLDLGEGVTARITTIRYAPRPGMAGRMVGGRFEGSNDPRFNRDRATLGTVTQAPPEGVLTSRTVSVSRAFRYLRYVGPPDGYGNVAEIQFLGERQGLEAPAVPTGVTADRSDNTRVELAWDAVTGATRYSVLRSESIGGPYAVVGFCVDPAFTDIGLAADRDYTYVVRALNPAGASGPSQPVEALAQGRRR